MCHAAVLNLLMGICYHIGLSIMNPVIVMLRSLFITLSKTSVFPLAFTRFFYLYYESKYDKFFSKKKLFLWLVLYDFIMIGGISIDLLRNAPIDFPYSTSIIYTLTLVKSIVCSTLIFLKLRKMTKLLISNTKLEILKDLRRATYIVVFQSAYILLQLMMILYSNIYVHIELTSNNYYTTYTFRKILYAVVTMALNSSYFIFVIVDTLITLFILESFKRDLKRIIWKVLMSLFMEPKKKSAKVSTLVIIKVWDGTSWVLGSRYLYF